MSLVTQNKNIELKNTKDTTRLIIIFNVKKHDNIQLEIVVRSIDFIIKMYNLQSSKITENNFQIRIMICSNIIKSFNLTHDFKRKDLFDTINTESTDHNKNSKFMNQKQLFWNIGNVLEKYEMILHTQKINFYLVFCLFNPINDNPSNKNIIQQFTKRLNKYNSIVHIFTSFPTINTTYLQSLATMGARNGKIRHIQNEYDIITHLYEMYKFNNIVGNHDNCIMLKFAKIITILGKIKQMQLKYKEQWHTHIEQWHTHIEQLLTLLNAVIPYIKMENKKIKDDQHNKELYTLIENLYNFEDTKLCSLIKIDNRFDFIQNFANFIITIGGLKAILETMCNNNGELTDEIRIIFNFLQL